MREECHILSPRFFPPWFFPPIYLWRLYFLLTQDELNSLDLSAVCRANNVRAEIVWPPSDKLEENRLRQRWVTRLENRTGLSFWIMNENGIILSTVALVISFRITLTPQV